MPISTDCTARAKVNPVHQPRARIVLSGGSFLYALHYAFQAVTAPVRWLREPRVPTETVCWRAGLAKGRAVNPDDDRKVGEHRREMKALNLAALRAEVAR